MQHTTTTKHIMSDNEVLSDVDSQADDETQVSTDVATPLSSDTEEEKVAEQEIITFGSTSCGSQTQSPYCGICYTDLNLENIVNTQCSHQFCKACFYRWIEVNATCPCCRAPIDSKTNLTDEQMQRELQEVYLGYTELLQRHSCQLERNQKAREKYYDLRDKTNELMRRQISLREMMDETEGYNEGYLAAAFEFFHGRNRKYTSALLSASVKRKGFMKGFHTGASRESRRLDRIAKEFKRQAKRNVKIKKRLVQSNLWDCGVVDMDDVDPLENVTDETTDTEESSDASNSNLEEQFASMTV